MPVTKTAKRALRSSQKKEAVNKKIISRLEIALRNAKKSKKETAISKVASLADIAAKKHIIHKNKAARIKSTISKLFGKETKKQTGQKNKATTKKSSKKK